MSDSIIQPLVCHFANVIEGKGFKAQVDARLLAIIDSELFGLELGVYGVQPGGISGEGGRERDALHRFRASYLSRLNNIARISANYADFARRLMALFADVHGPNRQDFDRALQVTQRVLARRGARLSISEYEVTDGIRISRRLTTVVAAGVEVAEIEKSKVYLAEYPDEEGDFFQVMCAETFETASTSPVFNGDAPDQPYNAIERALWKLDHYCSCGKEHVYA